MIDWIIDNLFGSWGRVVLDFYIANALIINSVVVLYGVLLVALNLRLKPYRAAAVAQVRRIVSAAGSPPRGTALPAFVEKRFDWSEVAAIGPGRMVVGRWRLWPSRVTPESLKRHLPMTELCRDALA
ncbi:MAG: hypothetical protein KF761_02705 [Salinibacterium sp.]|nr:hypothetical protein [Salinibacterium sp.]